MNNFKSNSNNLDEMDKFPERIQIIKTDSRRIRNPEYSYIY